MAFLISSFEEDVYVFRYRWPTKRDGIISVLFLGKLAIRVRILIDTIERMYENPRQRHDWSAKHFKDSRMYVRWSNGRAANRPAAKCRKRALRWERTRKKKEKKRIYVESPWPCLFPNGFYAPRAVVGGPSPSHDGDGRRQSLSRFPREWDNRNTGFCG